MLDPLIEDFDKQRVEAKRSGDNVGDAGMLFGCLCGQSGNIVGPVSAGGQKPGTHDYSGRSSFYTASESFVNVGVCQLHVCWLYDATGALLAKQFHHFEQHVIGSLPS